MANEQWIIANSGFAGSIRSRLRLPAAATIGYASPAFFRENNPEVKI